MDDEGSLNGDPLEEEEEEDTPVVIRKPAAAKSFAKFLMAKAKAKTEAKAKKEQKAKKEKKEKKEPPSPIFSDAGPDGFLSS